MHNKIISFVVLLLLTVTLMLPTSTFAQTESVKVKGVSDQGSGGQVGGFSLQGFVNSFTGTGGNQTGFSINGIADSVTGIVSDFFNRPFTTTGNIISGTVQTGYNVVTTVVTGAGTFVRNVVTDLGDVITGTTSSFTPVDSGYSDPTKGGTIQPPPKPTGAAKPGTTGTGGGTVPGSEAHRIKGSVNNPLSTGGSSDDGDGRDPNDPMDIVSPGSEGAGENNPSGAGAETN